MYFYYIYSNLFFVGINNKNKNRKLWERERERVVLYGWDLDTQRVIRHLSPATEPTIPRSS